MESDRDHTLETDRLEQLLETPPPPQSVVVVEYRNRGVPTWIFFPLILLVPLGVLLVYDRTVSERERAQAALTRQSLESLAAGAGTSAPAQPPNAAAANTAPAGTLYIVEPGNPPTSPVSEGPAPATASAVAPAIGPDGQREAGPATASPAPTPAGLGASRAPVENSVAGTATGPASALSDPPADAQAHRTITRRTILPNPFPDGAKPPVPPAPGDDHAQNAKPNFVATEAPDTPPPGRDPRGDGTNAAATQVPAGELADRDRDRGNELGNRNGEAALEPLPSKEESLRQIEEEAAKLRADRLAQVENKLATQRSHRIDSQLKFREELREAIRGFGNQAGPEIDKIAKRYSTDVDPVNWKRAYQKWRLERGLTQSAKVKYIRDLELPEVVILDFLSDDLHPQVKKRGGPRNESEARVRAATLLLHYNFPGADLAPPLGAQGPAPANGAGRP